MENTDLFQEAIKLLSAHRRVAVTNDSQKHIIGEIITRLKRADGQYSKIMKSNSSLLKESPDLIQTRLVLSDEKLLDILRDQSKNDPELANFLQKTGGRLFRKRLTEGSAHDLNVLDEQSNPQSEEIKTLNFVTEEFYENLWLTILSLNQLSLFTNFKPKGVTDVRNQLIVHEHRKEGGAHVYSFGFTLSGPVLRPMKPTGIEITIGKGFYQDVAEFLNGIIRKLN